MKQLTQTALQQGYFKIPKALLKQQTGNKQSETLGAFLQLLAWSNYSEMTYYIHGTEILCQRGESLISNQH